MTTIELLQKTKAAWPALSAAPARQQETKKEEDLVEKEEQSRFSYLRQLNALKVEMKTAVHQENCERAAALRDPLPQREADHTDPKSGA